MLLPITRLSSGAGRFITSDDARGLAGSWTGLTDTASSIVAGQIVVGNTAGNALIFSPRDVIWVDHTPPSPTEANERNVVIAKISGSLWTQKQETIHGTPSRCDVGEPHLRG